VRRIAIVLAFALVAGCGSRVPAPGGTFASEVEVIELPSPVESGTMSLEEALATRRSVREFSSETLSIETTAQLLWAAQGVTSTTGKRTAPSAGALYPLELYVADHTGVHHYLPVDHALERVSSEDLRPALQDAALGQDAIGDAVAVFVITGVEARTEAKYGDRAERYVKLEAGHAAQNLLLQAVALDLGAVPVGAFGDLEVQGLLGLPSDEEPLYLIAVGYPAGSG
jgi:SagB-type dehydrogenase family enzyme